MVQLVVVMVVVVAGVEDTSCGTISSGDGGSGGRVEDTSCGTISSGDGGSGGGGRRYKLWYN